MEAEEIQELEEKVKAFAPNYIGYIEEGSYEILPTSEVIIYINSFRGNNIYKFVCYGSSQMYRLFQNLKSC